MNEEEKKEIELDIEAKYVGKTEKEFLSRLTYAECLYILTPENEYCDEVIKLSVLKIREIIEKLQKENEKINSLIKKLEKDSKERQWIQTVDDEYLAYTEKSMYADELLSFLRGEE